MFASGFPYVDKEIVDRVLSIIPPNTYGDCSVHVCDTTVDFLGISFPYRLYTLDVEDSVLLELDYIERTVLHCVYTRSCEGYVREKHIKALLSGDFQEWTIPYIVKVCDEYVMEILQTVYSRLKEIRINSRNFALKIQKISAEAIAV